MNLVQLESNLEVLIVVNVIVAIAIAIIIGIVVMLFHFLNMFLFDLFREVVIDQITLDAFNLLRKPELIHFFDQVPQASNIHPLKNPLEHRTIHLVQLIKQNLNHPQSLEQKLRVNPLQRTTAKVQL